MIVRLLCKVYAFVYIKCVRACVCICCFISVICVFLLSARAPKQLLKATIHYFYLHSNVPIINDTESAPAPRTAFSKQSIHQIPTQQLANKSIHQPTKPLLNIFSRESQPSQRFKYVQYKRVPLSQTVKKLCNRYNGISRSRDLKYEA